MLLNLYINEHHYIYLGLHLCPSVFFKRLPHKITAYFPLDVTLVFVVGVVVYILLTYEVVPFFLLHFLCGYCLSIGTLLKFVYKSELFYQF